MTVTARFAAEFIQLARKELVDAGNEDPTLEEQLELIKSWSEIYEDVEPRNRAEHAVHDGLEEARERLSSLIKYLESVS